MATPGQVGQPEAGQSEGPLVQVIVENLLGHRESIIVPSTATVRQLKQEIEARMKVRVSSQTLIRRRPTGGSEVGYKQLDDAKTLDQYNIGDGERVLLVPSMRSAPPGYELKVSAFSVYDVFLGGLERPYRFRKEEHRVVQRFSSIPKAVRRSRPSSTEH